MSQPDPKKLPGEKVQKLKESVGEEIRKDLHRRVSEITKHEVSPKQAKEIVDGAVRHGLDRFTRDA